MPHGIRAFGFIDDQHNCTREGTGIATRLNVGINCKDRHLNFSIFQAIQPLIIVRFVVDEGEFNALFL